MAEIPQKHDDLGPLIRRRKALDKIFALIGFLSITIGLATLAALLYSLWHDAQPRLRVAQGTVDVTEGRVKGPEGRDLSPAEQAWEIRKISGDSLLEMPKEDTASLIDLTQFFDFPKIQQLGRDGTLQKLVEEKKFDAIVRTDYAKSLLAAGKISEFVAIRKFVPEKREAELRSQGALTELVNVDELKKLLEADPATLINARKLGDANDADYGEADIVRWINAGELEWRWASVLRKDRLENLVHADKVQAFSQAEYALAQKRPKEFNTSFFLTLKPSAYPETTGILVAWVDSLVIILVTMLVALPIGVGAGVYLEEYAPKNKLTALIEINIANLAGVPSIIFGLMALGVFIYQLHLGRTIATAGMTLALLVLPIVIMATREAIRAIPQHIREASYACGATKWQTVWYHILPYSSGGILTGSIIGLSRAIGETAPLITIGALTFVTTLPWQGGGGASPVDWLSSGFTAMPLLMYNLISKPQPEFHQSAALAGIVLIFMTLSLNAVAIYLRYRLRKNIKW